MEAYPWILVFVLIMMNHVMSLYAKGLVFDSPLQLLSRQVMKSIRILLTMRFRVHLA